jgi:prophage regulatory protein
MTEERFLRIKDVVTKTTLSRSNIYRKVADGTFPKPRRISHRVAVWRLSEIESWMAKSDLQKLLA